MRVFKIVYLQNLNEVNCHAELLHILYKQLFTVIFVAKNFNDTVKNKTW